MTGGFPQFGDFVAVHWQGAAAGTDTGGVPGPTDVHIRALAVDFFISLLNTVDGWAERTLSEIQGWEDLSPDGKNDRGLEIFAQLPAPTPREPTDRTPVPPRTQRRRPSSGQRSTE